MFRSITISSPHPLFLVISRSRTRYFPSQATIAQPHADPYPEQRIRNAKALGLPDPEEQHPHTKPYADVPTEAWKIGPKFRRHDELRRGPQYPKLPPEIGPELNQPPVENPESLARPKMTELQANFSPYRWVYPEFLPDPELKWRNRIREKLERIDMLRRRGNIEIPEFYVGSIMKIGVSDEYAIGKLNEFVGICIERGGTGLRAHFTLRNVVDGTGVEIRYEMYNPIVQFIQVLRLEKRLDENLRYLRDCPLEYSTFPFDMTPELRNPDAPVPINPMLVRIKPRPWTVKWHLKRVRGIENLYEQVTRSKDWWKWEKFDFGAGTNVNKYDLMKTYRSTVPLEDQTEIFAEVGPQLTSLTQTLKKQKRKKVFQPPVKTA